MTQNCRALETDLKTINELYEAKCV